MLTTMVVIWVALAVTLVVLSIHRSILVMREEDTLFLSSAEQTAAEHYAKTSEELKRVEAALKFFTYSTGVLAVLTAAVWVYQRLYG